MSKIQWTDATWNPVTGCEYASPGCKNCYAVVMTKRLEAMGQEKYQGLLGKAHFNGVVKTHEDELTKPLRWKKPRMVFVNSMSDLFHESVPFEFIDKVFAVMALTSQHTYQVLTKRPERMAEFLIDRWKGFGISHMSSWGAWCSEMANWVCDFGLTKWREEEDDEFTNDRIYDELISATSKGRLPNVWLGASCENQEMLELRVPHLLKCPASVRFLSCEPLLGSLDLSNWMDIEQGLMTCQTCGDEFAEGEANHNGRSPCCLAQGDPQGSVGGSEIDWVIVGGESGSKARPCNVEWIRSIVDQCQDASVPVFVKQLGENAFDSLESVDAWKSRGVPTIHTMNRNAFITFRKRKGGNPDEWPEDLRVRQFPEVAR